MWGTHMSNNDTIQTGYMQVCSLPVLVPVTPAENEAIRNGEVQWFIRKTVPFYGEFNILIRALCCQKRTGIIDTEFFFDRYITIDPHEDSETFTEFAKKTQMSLAEIRKYAGDRKHLCAWHITASRPLMAVDTPTAINISDFGIKRVATSWKYSPFVVTSHDREPAFRISCDVSQPFGDERYTTYLPASDMDKDVEYVQVVDLFQKPPEGFMLVGRKDGLPYKGQIKWLIRAEDAQAV